MLQIGPGGRAAWNEGAVHLVRVGTADVPDKGFFGSWLTAAPSGGDVQPAAVLLASGAGAFDHLPALAAIYRVHSWVAPLDPRSVHVWQIAGLLARESRAQAVLGRYGDLYALSGPDSALLDARAKGRVAAERMVLIGGEVSVLLLGFALVCAIGLRRGLAAERRRLLQRGARRLQLWLALGAEVTALTLSGAAVGVAGGAAAVVLLARRAGVPGGAALGHSLGTALGSALVLAAWLAATAAVVGAARARDDEGRRGRVRLSDAAALGALAAVGLALARGGLDAGAASGGNATLLLLLPGLICFVAAVAAGRLLAPTMRLLERLARSAPAAAPAGTPRPRPRPLAHRRHGVVPAREPGPRALRRGLPLDARARGARRGGVRRSARLHAERGLATRPAARRGAGRRLCTPGPGGRRLSGRPPDCERSGHRCERPQPDGPGRPGRGARRLHWRSDFSASPPADLARRIGADGPAQLRGIALPRDAATVSLRVRIRGVAVRARPRRRGCRTSRRPRAARAERPRAVAAHGEAAGPPAAGGRARDLAHERRGGHPGASRGGRGRRVGSCRHARTSAHCCRARTS